MDGYSNDLLKNEFMSRNRVSDENVKLEEEDGEIELSLGLSMNGRFGVDPERKKLRRASSISNLVFAVGVAYNGSRHKERGAALETYAPLARACSLPTQAEEWRHRKVLESTRSMEARKKRMEKLKNVRMLKDTEISTENGNNGNGSNDLATVKDNVRIIGDGNLNLVENVKQTSQGSIGSQRSGSSGISDGQSQTTEGAKQLAEVKSSSGSKSELERNEQKSTIEAAVREAKGPNISHQNVMQDMPFVSTKAYGPNGTKVDGFLYRYKKGEDVRIVCVCHGMFLSPAEFVKHGGGGGNVEHPLKHIVVNPSPLL
ncbi:ninja-family protein AFP3-like [Primulina eburnea]|uniref:ninja-family protein AFP3-like n=1 Tax=Primulina eburnea TaxID=1245227 RepID=UPI003C6C0F9E